MFVDKFDRQVLLFGENGQDIIEKQKIGIVGLGGIGSQIAQSLSYLGINKFVLIDDDIVEITNLNRLVGATDQDAKMSVLKVQVISRNLLLINSSNSIEKHSKNLRSNEALTALKSCDYIFGCVDNDAARLILSELSAAYSIPLIDSATEIFASETPLSWGGRVIITQPGKLCLSCADAIDLRIAKQELESKETQNLRIAHGYGLGKVEKSPAVISLNGIIANLAVSEFMTLCTGLREPNYHIIYHGERNLHNGCVITIRENKLDSNCFTCNYLFGKREKANIERYVLPEN